MRSMNKYIVGIICCCFLQFVSSSIIFTSPGCKVNENSETFSDDCKTLKICRNGIATTLGCPNGYVLGKDHQCVSENSDKNACGVKVPYIAWMCDKPIDLAFVMDTSATISENSYNQQKKFMKNVIANFNVGSGAKQTRVATVSFSDRVEVEFYFNDYTSAQEVQTAIDGIGHKFGKATRTYKGLEYTSEKVFAPGNGERPDAKNVVVVLTDGKINAGEYEHYWPALAWNVTGQEADKVRNLPAYVFAIGVGDASKNEIELIANKPSEEFAIYMNEYADLNIGTFRNTFSKRICERAIREQLVQCEDVKADIYFIADSSTSIGKDAFEDFKTFATKVVDKFTVGPEGIHVGLISFADDSSIEFRLNKYYDKEEINKAIMNTPYTTGSTNTHKALEDLVKYGFNEQYGARDSSVPKIVITVTDGGSAYPTKTESLALKAKKMGIKMFAIAVGPHAKMYNDELEQLASDPKDEYFFTVDNYAALSKIEDELAKKTCTVAGRPQFTT